MPFFRKVSFNAQNEYHFCLKEDLWIESFSFNKKSFTQRVITFKL